MFCPNCDILMRPKKKDGKVEYVCPKCGYKSNNNTVNKKLGEKIKRNPLDEIPVFEQENIMLPVVQKICPKCEHNEAYFWSRQTRSSDEPETRFYCCTKCKHTWREYS